MNLFIQIKDGNPLNHPILENNFKQAFPNVDVNNLPSDFSFFERVSPPIIGPYEIYEGVTYEWFHDIVKDVHHVRPMTEEEKLEKQNFVKKSWVLNDGYLSWIFDEKTCAFIPPVQKPNDGQIYSWNEENKLWVKIEIGA